MTRHDLDTTGQIMARPTLVQRWASVLALVVPTLSFGQAIAVPASQTSLFGSPAPTMTFLFEAQHAKSTLVFVPGGGGHFGIEPEWTAEHRYFSFPFNRMLRRLTDPMSSSGQVNLVIFDNPSEISFRRGWSGARMAPDHLSRVEDVVRFYADKLGKPVWLMGHSAGSISITELYKGLQARKQEGLVAGLICSASIFGTSLNAATRLPVLVMHHAKDECVSAPPAHAVSLYTSIEKAGNQDAELALLQAGKRAPGGQDPCASGFHLYLGAYPEAAQTIDRFMATHAAPR